MIVERVRAGVARAKASGTKSGKAFGRPRTPLDLEKRIREALATPGRPGFHKIAAQFGVAAGAVQRIAAAYALVRQESPAEMMQDEIEQLRAMLDERQQL